VISHRHPGSEARAGRFPGPSSIADLHAIQREDGWLPRGGAEADSGSDPGAAGPDGDSS
jgi:hypothetical protein